MDSKLLTAAVLSAALILSAPSQAQPVAGMGFPSVSSPGPPGVRPFPDRFARCADGDRRDMRRDGRRDLRFRCPFADGFAYADGEWALYNNRAFAPDSYNDWWNDRPDRAFPRWVQEQRARGTCDPDRMWWSGSGWHC
jgi:hypothetical protein